MIHFGTSNLKQSDPSPCTRMSSSGVCRRCFADVMVPPCFLASPPNHSRKTPGLLGGTQISRTARRARPM